jgi:SAM-dependent methyltransferase
LSQSDAELDGSYGFKIAEVEKEVESRLSSLGGAELWHRQGPGVFQTPYAELEQMVHELGLPAGSTLVDLGCAYGRLGIVMARRFPSLHFVGFEISPERVAEARRVYSVLGIDPLQVRQADLALPSFCPPRAQAYFVYDYGTRPAVEKTLEDLKGLRRQASGESGVFRVVARGRLSRDLIERQHPWLSQVHAPRHLGNFSIYQS